MPVTLVINLPRPHHHCLCPSWSSRVRSLSFVKSGCHCGHVCKPSCLHICHHWALLLVSGCTHQMHMGVIQLSLLGESAGCHGCTLIECTWGSSSCHYWGNPLVTVVGLDSSWLAWIHHDWHGFIVIGMDSLWFIVVGMIHLDSSSLRVGLPVLVIIG